jgi:hypothetical protein
MGILDDAIKEHLELKRAHGASDDEIRRKEAEAFGQPRQEAAAAAPPEVPEDEHTQLLTPDEPVQAEEPGLADLEPLEPAPEDPYAVHPGDDLVPDPDVPPAAEAGAGTFEPGGEADPGPPAPRAHDHHHDEQHPALVDHDHIGGEEHAPEPVFRQSAETPTAPPGTPLDPAPVEDPPVGDPPVEHPDIDEPPPRQSPEHASSEHASSEDDDEDVLEETPEFLQDAPEHDRLWFEQKPPRDFDFGE